MQDSERPLPQTVAERATLERWYWTKQELIDMARRLGLPSSGSKPVLTQRIAHYLDTGVVLRPSTRRPSDGMDWRHAALTTETVITPSYRNTKNVRTFFVEQCGTRFRFSNEFMQWMRDHVGNTLGNAVAFWHDLDRRKREDGYREASLPQNQFNAFTRALSEAIPGISAGEIRRLWAIKRAGPAPHVYEPGDELR